MNRTFLGIVSSLIVLFGLLFLLNQEDRQGRRKLQVSNDPESSILLYCAASNQVVVEAIRADYEAEFGHKVEIQYGASQTLLSSIEVSGTGDLYLPADESYLQIADEKQLVEEVFPLAKMQLVIAVKKGNPKGIKSFEDLLNSENRTVQANPEAAAVGKLTQEILQESGQWDALDSATIGYRTTVTDVANDVILGAADAAIVYDAVLSAYPDLEAVSIPEFESGVANIAVGVVSSSKQPRAALHFARYLAAKDRGQNRYKEYGFRPVYGDLWEDVPQVSIYAGAMLKPAIEKSIVEFEEREGVEVTRVYNGCGILVSQMNGGELPDAYFACDAEFMQQVQEKFGDPLIVSQNELVIVVQKGNPHKIKSLKDLSNEGIRVGIGNEHQCAMGWLTQKTLTEGGVATEVMANVATQAPTGDLLVNEMKIGALDAAVVYLSNAAGAADDLDAIRITDISCSLATQPFAISRETEYSQLAQRFLTKLRSEESRERFQANGFEWKLDAVDKTAE